MTALEQFLAQHGTEWTQIVNGRAWPAAMTLASVEKLERIAQLSDEDIRINGQIILADFRGHLQHENALSDLPTRKEFKFGGMPAETYPDPETEAYEETKAELHEPHTETFVFQPPISISPTKEKPKKRRKRRKRRVTKHEPPKQQ